MNLLNIILLSIHAICLVVVLVCLINNLKIINELEKRRKKYWDKVLKGVLTDELPEEK